jgi:Tfp pilus assembly protein PilZ
MADDVRILIVVGDGEAGKAYAEAISDIGVGYDVAVCFNEMAALAKERPYCGLIIDILTLVRCSKEEKAIAYDSINIFPVLRVKWDKNRKKINLSPVEQAFSPDADSVLRMFIETRCKAFPPRRLRRHKRKQMTLNVVVSTEPSFPPESTYKSFTTNVSTHGLFLYTMERFQIEQRLWLKFMEIKDQAPVLAAVKWSLEWGVSRSVPGVGVSLEELSPAQERELRGIINL